MAAVRSFAQAAATETAVVPLRSVQIDGLAVAKIVKNCTESMPSLVTGLLLGLDIGSTLEVTNCFPFPSREVDEGAEGDEETASLADGGAMYQLEMMKLLREVNVDNNTVGWYQSTFLGSYQTVDLIETFLNYQENIKRCVCIIYDPLRGGKGHVSLKAIKLQSSFMEVYKSAPNSFTSEKLRVKNLSWADVFEEIPVTISNSSLVSAFMSDLRPQSPLVSKVDSDRLSLSFRPVVEKSLSFLVDSLDDLSAETQKFQYHSRAAQRQLQQQAGWLQKRRSENAARRAAGEDPLPEEDPTNPIFKPVPEPSRIDSFLVLNSMDNYSKQISSFVGPAMTKLYIRDALRR